MPSETSIASTDQSVEELRRELAEAREQQAAAADILASISSSATDVSQVFAKIAVSAARLCDAYDATILRVDGDLLCVVANHGSIPQDDTLPLTRELVSGRAVLDGKTIHVADLRAECDEYPQGSDHARRLGHRTILAVPLIRANEAIGAIAIRRKEVRPFTDRQLNLLKTFADQAVIAIENARLFEEVGTRSRELGVALEQQTATSEILDVISRSPGELESVFQAVLKSATQLCAAKFGTLYLREGSGFRAAAMHNAPPAFVEARAGILYPPPDTAIGQVAKTKRPTQIADVTVERPYVERDPFVVAFTALGGYRSVLTVPLLKEDELIGAISIYRQAVGSFADKEVELVTNFAAQAVIAIENTRLFEAEQASKRELQESLEYQTATSEVLAVISSSPNELQPVLYSIVATANRLCAANYAIVFIRDDDGMYSARASSNADPAFIEWVRNNPIAYDRGSVVGRVALAKRTVHLPDCLADPEFTRHAHQQHGKFRSMVGVPLIKSGEAVGVIFLARTEVRPFTERQIDLVTTFADQAVIAINNVGLFEEVQARTRQLSEALEQQTATSDVLQIISRSPGEIAPVFTTILMNATRICAANYGLMFLCEKDALRTAAIHGALPAAYTEQWRAGTLLRPDPELPAFRAVKSRQPVQIADMRTASAYRDGDLLAVSAVETAGIRTVVAVPIIKDNKSIGVIAIYRTEVRPFTDRQIELVTSFASQAVIAIENARLFEEVQARNRDLTALSEVGRAVSSTLDLKLVLKTIVERAVDLSDTDAGSMFYYREETGRFELGETMGLDEVIIAGLRRLNIAARDSGLGEAITQRKPLLIPDLTKRESNPLRTASIEAGFRAAIIVPLLGSDGPLGTLVLQRREPGEFPGAIVSLVQSFADQSVIALENARLFEEIARKSHELEIASQHKSQFVANMSHELRTPLAAILGYAELMQEGFYEPLGQKSLDALTRIRSNGRHLLGLINTVLDIAKIESGQFTLNMAEYAIESVVETVRSATESLAQNKKLALKTEVAKPLPIGLGDEQRLTQVLLNLVGNAIKFTDSGEVCVSAKAVNGQFNISVTDTGPGIPTEHQTRIFEQFHQVDSSNTKAKGGTGLGLAIAKQIVEMHGGRIWVESTLGEGATFQMELPTRAELRKPA
jgi:GAF domain-containing protein/anti-sigma regulatory factor (Ser/Thr protein kinase)